MNYRTKDRLNMVWQIPLMVVLSPLYLLTNEKIARVAYATTIIGLVGVICWAWISAFISWGIV